MHAKQSDIYFEVLESLKEQSQSQEKEVIIKIYENAIRAMINVNFRLLFRNGI
jgi:hypothetical protein